MRFLLFSFAVLTFAQTPGSIAVRENYSKFEYRIPMRDGVKLFTSVYIPKDVFSDGENVSHHDGPDAVHCAPYGPDVYRNSLGPSDFFQKEKFIFVYQDVRGRYMSEGEFDNIRPHKPVKGPKDTDESTDTYDSIDWLVKNLPGNTGKIGLWGISQPGFYSSAGMIDAHPALLAVSPQAPVTDYYLGDDNFHNGAFMLAANFRFYLGFTPREGDPARPPPRRRLSISGLPTATIFSSVWARWPTPTKNISSTRIRTGFRTSITRLRRSVAIALDLETLEGHQARGDGRGRLVRRRGFARTSADVRVHGEELASEDQHAGDGSVDVTEAFREATETAWATSLSGRIPDCTIARRSNLRFSCIS